MPGVPDVVAGTFEGRPESFELKPKSKLAVLADRTVYLVKDLCYIIISSTYASVSWIETSGDV